jgi:hypothetical protein
MTTVEHLRASVSRAACDIPVAGVPWPAYKLYALIVGAVVFLVVGVVTMSAGAAVLSAAGAATLVGVSFHLLCATRR